MNRRLFLGFSLILLAGCQSLQDQDTIRPLPEPGPKPTQTYPELLMRARRQADVALDRAFRNLWVDVEDVAKSLQQTARLLPLAPEVPEKKTEPEKLWKELAVEAKKLETAAKEIVPLAGAERDKKQKEIDDIILRINRNVRTLRSLQ